MPIILNHLLIKPKRLFQMNFFILGGLHTEQFVLDMHGKPTKGCGLHTVLQTNGLSIIGTSAAVNVNDIKPARYFFQVPACAIYIKLHIIKVNLIYQF